MTVGEPAPVRPQATTLVVVGVEKHAAGSAWNLSGPASDARRFADWFWAQGVPPERTYAFVSALPHPDDAWRDAPVAPRPAEHGEVRTALVRTLAEQEGDLLVVIWGGHGLVTSKGARHLFTADATARDPINVNLDEMLRLHRSSGGPAFARQLWLVDACQAWHAVIEAGADLPDESFGALDMVPGRTQEVLLAASAGESAANISRRRTGLFSQSVFQFLDTAPEWPPDAARLSRQLAEHFSGLRAQRAAAQTPAYFWVKDRAGNEGQIMGNLAVQPAAPRLTATPELPSARDMIPVVSALDSIPAFSSQGMRDEIISALRQQIRGSIARQTRSRPEAASLVAGCSRFSGGLEELRGILELWLGDDLGMGAVADALDRLIILRNARSGDGSV